MESPGTLLQRAREARGISVRELASATRIPLASLRHIEEDAYDELPAEVFTRGFLRNAARELKIDEGNIIQAYEVHTGKKRESALRKLEIMREDGGSNAAPVFAPRPFVQASPRARSWFRLPTFDGLVEFVGSAKPVYVIGTLLALLGLALAVSVFTSSLERSQGLTLSDAPPTKASWNVKADGAKARWILNGQSNLRGATSLDIAGGESDSGETN